MTLPRFTIRRLMVAVAIAGLSLAFWSRCERRSAYFRKLSKDHELSIWRVAIDEGQFCSIDETPRIAYHHAMITKYARAARYPWLPVAPDPPEPK